MQKNVLHMSFSSKWQENFSWFNLDQNIYNPTVHLLKSRLNKLEKYQFLINENDIGILRLYESESERSAFLKFKIIYVQERTIKNRISFIIFLYSIARYYNVWQKETQENLFDIWGLLMGK